MKLKGERSVVSIDDADYPEILKTIENPPEKLYVIGNISKDLTGLAISGPRKCTPEGAKEARLLAESAAANDITVITGGALGIDTAAMDGAVLGCADGKGASQCVVLGGGIDQIYPVKNAEIFQRVIDDGGVVISEHEWDFPPVTHCFTARNRIIVGLAKALFVPELSVPSGTYNTVNLALKEGRELWVSPFWAVPSDGARFLFENCTRIVRSGQLSGRALIEVFVDGGIVKDHNGEDVVFKDAAAYMDGEITEEMLRDGYDSDHGAQAFFDEYARRHANKYGGEQFAPYYGLAW